MNRAILHMNMLCLLIALVPTAGAQKKQSPSSTPVRDVEYSDRTMNILPDLARRYRVVIGVSGIIIGTDNAKVNIVVRRGTLADVFNAITSRDSRFQWHQSDNGSIHFSVGNSPLSLANVSVRAFEVHNPIRIDFSSQIARIPEVHAWLSEHNCLLEQLFMGKPPTWKHFSIQRENAPVSSLFDEAASKSETYFWAAILYTGNPCRINVSF